MIDIQELLVKQAGGGLVVELNDTLQRLIADCRDTGKKGSLGLSLVIEPMTTRDGSLQVKITPSVVSKNPKYDAGIGVYWVVTDEQNNPVGLEQENPAQAKLFADMEKETR